LLPDKNGQLSPNGWIVFLSINGDNFTRD